MTVDEIRQLVVSAAPAAKHYHSPKEGDSFTVWGEYERTGQSADDRHDFGWLFEIDHYTRDEDDPIPEKIEQALIDHPGVGYTYRVGYDPKYDYIRHIFDCEGY